MDRYLASLRAPSPTYEDPYAYWGGTRPALQYGLPPTVARPDATGWTVPSADYGMGHPPAGMPPPGAPPPVVTGPGGPLPSTPQGSVLPGMDPRAAEGAFGPGFDQARSTPVPLAVQFAPGYRHSARWQQSGTPRFFTGYTGDPATWRGQVFGGETPAGRLARYARDEQGYGMDPAEAWQHAYGRVYRMLQETGGTPAELTGLAAGIPAQYRAAGGAGAAGGDPYQAAANHVTQALSGGTTGGTAMPDQRDPTYHGTPNNMGATGVPATGAGGALPDTNAAYLLDPQNRAALQAYIAGRGGVSPSTHSLLGNYIYDTVAPMFSSALTSLGLDTPGGMQGNIDQWFQQGRGNTLFSGLRNAAQQRLGSGGFASDLAALGDPRAQAGLLNQLINLTTTGTSALHRAATQQQLIDRQRQFELQSGLSQDPTQLGNYMQYFQGLPGWDRLVGGGGGL